MTKTEIVKAAFKVWGRNFYRKTSLSQLAGELKVSKPALYRHFINKHALNTAMTEYFLDDFAASIKPDMEKALNEKDPDKGIAAIIGGISGFFAGNVYALIFSLMNIYQRNIDDLSISERLKERGADIGILQKIIERKYNADPSIIRLIFTTLTFLMSHFHKIKKALDTQVTEDDKKNITLTICETVMRGLGYPAEKAEIDFEKLEKILEETSPSAESEPFFKAVAEAVAEAGPWNVSMDMVAKKLGLSKSSLYGHFKNKKDMLRRLFMTEFKRIIEFARQGIKLSPNPAEQLYLGLYSISIYLRSRPEILIAMDWIRTRKLDLGKPEKEMEIFRLFEDIDIEPLINASEIEKQRASHWILFLLINILTHHNGSMRNNSIRMLYKFIIFGLGGFNK